MPDLPWPHKISVHDCFRLIRRKADALVIIQLGISQVPGCTVGIVADLLFIFFLITFPVPWVLNRRPITAP
jgi:hypothetical protein